MYLKTNFKGNNLSVLKNGSGKNELAMEATMDLQLVPFRTCNNYKGLEVGLSIAKISGDFLYLPTKSNSRTQSGGAYFP